MGSEVRLIHISAPLHTAVWPGASLWAMTHEVPVSQLVPCSRASVGRRGAPGMMVLGECGNVPLLLCYQHIKTGWLQFVKNDQQLILNTLNAMIIKMES